MPNSHTMSLRHADAFDRVRFRADGPIAAKTQASLAELCIELDVTAKSTPFNRRWTHDIDIKQPHAAFFGALADGLASNISIEPYYTEVARDYPTSTVIEALRMDTSFRRHCILAYSRGQVVCVGPAYYINRRGAAKVLTAYADGPSKLFTSWAMHPCLHTEIRFSDASHLRDEGLRGIGDFIDFDFDAFWKKHLRFLSVQSREALGRAVGCQSDRSDSLRRAARQMLANERKLEEKQQEESEASDGPCIFVGGVFSMQQFVAKYPHAKGALAPTTAKAWERQARALALDPVWFHDLLL